jgi:hypothetical protein
MRTVTTMRKSVYWREYTPSHRNILRALVAITVVAGVALAIWYATQDDAEPGPAPSPTGNPGTGLPDPSDNPSGGVSEIRRTAPGPASFTVPTVATTLALTVVAFLASAAFGYNFKLGMGILALALAVLFVSLAMGAGLPDYQPVVTYSSPGEKDAISSDKAYTAYYYVRTTGIVMLGIAGGYFLGGLFYGGGGRLGFYERDRVEDRELQAKNMEKYGTTEEFSYKDMAAYALSGPVNKARKAFKSGKSKVSSRSNKTTPENVEYSQETVTEV